MEEKKDNIYQLQLASVNDLSTIEVTKELVMSPQFAKEYEYLLSLENYITAVKAAVNEGLKTIAKDNYFETGESSVASGDYRYIYVPETTRESFNVKALKADDPELYKKYVNVSPVKETFRVMKVKKKEEGEDVAKSEGE